MTDDFRDFLSSNEMYNIKRCISNCEDEIELIFDCGDSDVVSEEDSDRIDELQVEIKSLQKELENKMNEMNMTWYERERASAYYG